MYALAIAASVAAGSVASIPHFQLGSLDVGIPIQSFGVIVAAGVLIGAALLRRYAEWHGVSDEHIRGILGWITIAGFLGAHWFDVLAYEPHKLDEPMASWPPSKWPVLLRIWDGISSYGGFVGGAVGFAIYVWWKRLPVRLLADISIVGLLPAFSIGRIGCTVVSDHVGSVVDKASWYAFLAMDYPRNSGLQVVQSVVTPNCGKDPTNCVVNAHGDYVSKFPDDGSGLITMWNLGLIEFLYLIPVNILVLWLAFRSKKRMPAGFLAVLTGVLYAPFRFFLDYLRPNETDARHAGLTFAQWCSLVAFAVAVYVASRLLKTGKPAETIAPSSKEAQHKLKLAMLKADEETEKEAEEAKAEKKAPLPKAKVEEKKKETKKADIKDGDEIPETEQNEVKKDDKKKSGVAAKAEEVPPTEMDMPALPKDIVKKSEKTDDKKAESKDEKKADEKAENKEDKAEEKKAEEKKEEAKADDKKADDKK